jgi:glutamyl-tRNA synthetase
MSVRVRFAPSPTGYLHIGGLRTALFNWLFARHNGGVFLVRIEDTDRERYTPEYEAAIVRSLDWAGIHADEPLVYQFARQPLHQQSLQKLLDSGHAYRCFCSVESLQKKRAAAEAAQGFYQYDGNCRTADQTLDQPYAVRFKVEISGDIITFNDLIRGEVSLQRNQLDDFIVARTDGSVTYNFAVIEDDHFMGITHVIRGEDHLLNTFKQILMYQALGYPVPHFAHLALILGDSGQKLSKRDAATSVDEYRDGGYLPAALCNYLARLGWSHKDQELFSTAELVSLFTLDNVQKKGAIFDLDKLRWINSVHMQNSDAAALLQVMQEQMNLDLAGEFSSWSPEILRHAVAVYQSRAHTLIELYQQLKSLYHAPESYDPQSLEEWIDNQVKNDVQLLQEKLQAAQFEKDELAEVIKQFCREHNVKMGNIAQPIRIALCGSASGPGLFDMLYIVGKAESLQRLAELAKM